MDALTNLLSDSLAEMGVVEKRKTKPMRNASAPMPTSSVSTSGIHKAQSSSIPPVTSPYGSFDPLDDFFGSGKNSLGKVDTSKVPSTDDVFGLSDLTKSADYASADLDLSSFDMTSAPSTPTVAANADPFGFDLVSPSTKSPESDVVPVSPEMMGALEDAPNPYTLSPGDGEEDLLGMFAGGESDGAAKVAPANDSVTSGDGGFTSLDDLVGMGGGGAATKPSSSSNDSPQLIDDIFGTTAPQPSTASEPKIVEDAMGAPNPYLPEDKAAAAPPQADFFDLSPATDDADSPTHHGAEADAGEAPSGGNNFTSLEDLMGATGGGGGKAQSGPDLGGGEGPGPQPQVIDDIFGTTHQPSAVSQAGKLDLGAGFGIQSQEAMGDPKGGEISLQAEAIDPNEPEHRKQLREKRIQGVQMRMAAALEDARERETIEAMEKAERSELAQYMGPKLEKWAKGKSDNVRALLSTLDQVLWENSGWKGVGMTDLMNPAQVKKHYRKAMIIMHPDKVKQKGGTTEQIYIADYLFDLTNQAWGHFQMAEM